MKTQVRRILAWAAILLAPVLMYATIRDLYNQNELNNPRKISYAYANILATQQYRGDLEARYRFHITKNGHLFSATDSLGRKNLFEVISLSDWNKMHKGSTTIKVKYLTSAPWVNEPADYVANNIADAISGIIFTTIIFALGVCTVLKANKPASYRGKLVRHNAGLLRFTHVAVEPDRDAQMQHDTQKKQYTKFPATFVACQIAGVLALLPVLAYIRGGALREKVVVLLPYLATRTWVWAELAVSILLLGIGARALFTSARKRQSHRIEMP